MEAYAIEKWWLDNRDVFENIGWVFLGFFAGNLFQKYCRCIC